VDSIVCLVLLGLAVATHEPANGERFA
jgi:hypothetical protein